MQHAKRLWNLRLLPLLIVLMGASVARAQAPAAVNHEALAERVREHADTQALAILGTWPRAERARPAWSYLRGRLLERQGEMAAAAEAFSFDDAGLPEGVRLELSLRRGRALLRAGRFAEAASALAVAASGRRGTAA
ncbi:MAG: hypothetical protein GXP55_16805, partial [Deltaproteobacteria bacterium]|nr:hypothetical protein [Deltaproteobacteria bacterium]